MFIILFCVCALLTNSTTFCKLLFVFDGSQSFSRSTSCKSTHFGCKTTNISVHCFDYVIIILFDRPLSNLNALPVMMVLQSVC